MLEKIENSNYRMIVLSLIVFFCTAAFYLPSYRLTYVPCDDSEYVRDNVHVRDGVTWEGLKWAFSSCGYAYNWHPLSWISLMEDVDLSNGSSLSDAEWRKMDNRTIKLMHVHNVILHCLNAALLTLLLLILCRSRLDFRWVALLALLWSLHPLRVEPVCWIAERKELLCVFWMLISIILYVKGMLTLSILAGGLSMLAKPVAVTLPAVMLAWDWVFRRRVRWLAFAVFSLMSFGTCVMTMLAQTQARDNGTLMGPLVRLTQILGSPVIYIRQTIWPCGLSAVYPVTNEPNWLLLICGALLVLAIIAVSTLWLVLRLRHPDRKNPVLDVLVFGIAWSYVGLIPMLGIVKVGWQEHADRYTYWIGCGIAVCAAMLLAEKGMHWWNKTVAFIEKVDQRSFDRTYAERCFGYALMVFVFVLGVVTMQRSEVWRNPMSYLSDSVPKSWSAEFAKVMCWHLIAEGRKEEVEPLLREVATRCPSKESYTTLAEYLMGKPVTDFEIRMGNRLHVEAGMLLDQVIEKFPDYKPAKDLRKKLAEIRKKAGQEDL